jgi:ApaG protein
MIINNSEKIKIKTNVTYIKLAEKHPLGMMIPYNLLNQFFWICSINIENSFDYDIKIIASKWTVINRNGFPKEINDIGVLGSPQSISKNSSFEYNSVINLNTPSGIVYGQYIFSKDDIGNSFVIDAEAASLEAIDVDPEDMRQVRNRTLVKPS